MKSSLSIYILMSTSGSTCPTHCDPATQYLGKHDPALSDSDIQQKCKKQGHTDLTKCLICHSGCNTGVAGTTDEKVAMDMGVWARARGPPAAGNPYTGPQWEKGYEFNKPCVTVCSTYGESATDSSMPPSAPFTIPSTFSPCSPFKGKWPEGEGPAPCFGGSVASPAINPHKTPPWCYTDENHICTDHPKWGYCDWRWFPSECIGGLTTDELVNTSCGPQSSPPPTSSAPAGPCDIPQYILPDALSLANLNVNDPAFDWGGVGAYKSPWLKTEQKLQHTILDPQPKAFDDITVVGDDSSTLKNIYTQMVNPDYVTKSGTTKGQNHRPPIWNDKELLYLNGYNLETPVGLDTTVADNYLQGLYNNQNQAQRINLNGVATPLGGTISKIGESYTGFSWYNNGNQNTYVPGYGPSPPDTYANSQQNMASNPNASDARLDMCGYFLASRPLNNSTDASPPMFANLKIEHSQNPLFYPGWWYTTDWECYYMHCVDVGGGHSQDSTQCYVDYSEPCGEHGVTHWAWRQNHWTPTVATDLQNCYVQNNLWNTGYNQFLPDKAYLNIAGIEYDNQLFRLPKEQTTKVLNKTWDNALAQAKVDPQFKGDPTARADEIVNQVLQYQLIEDMVRSPGSADNPVWNHTEDAQKYMSPAASREECRQFIQKLNDPCKNGGCPGPSSPYTPVIAWQYYDNECRGIPLKNQGEHASEMIKNAAGKDPIPLRVQSGGVVISGKGSDYYKELKPIQLNNPENLGRPVKNDFGVEVKWDIDNDIQYCTADTGLSNNFMDALTGRNVICKDEKDGFPTKSPNYLWLPDHMVMIGNKKITLENVQSQDDCYRELAKIRDNGIFQSYISSVHKHPDPLLPDIDPHRIRRIDNPPVWANYNEKLKTCDIINPLTVEEYDKPRDKPNSGVPMYVFGQYVKGAYDQIMNTEDKTYPYNVNLWPTYRKMHDNSSIFLTDEHGVELTKDLVPIAPSPDAAANPMGLKAQYRVADCLDWSMENGYPWVIFISDHGYGQCKAMNTKYWTTGAAGTDSNAAYRYADYNRPVGNDPMRVDGLNWAHDPQPWAYQMPPHMGREKMGIGMILDAQGMNESLKKCCSREMAFRNTGQPGLVPCPEGFQTVDTDLIASGLNRDFRNNREMCTWEELHCPTTLQKGNDCDIIMENWCKDANRKLGQGQWPTVCQCINQRIQMVDKNGYQIDPNATGGTQTLGTYAISQLPESVATAIKSNIYCTADACHTFGDEVYKPLIMRANDGIIHDKDVQHIEVDCHALEVRTKDCETKYTEQCTGSTGSTGWGLGGVECKQKAHTKCGHTNVMQSPVSCTMPNWNKHTTVYDPEACPSELCYTVSNIIGNQNQIEAVQNCGGKAKFSNSDNEHVLPTDTQKFFLIRIILMLIVILCSNTIYKYFILKPKRISQMKRKLDN